MPKQAIIFDVQEAGFPKAFKRLLLDGKIHEFSGNDAIHEIFPWEYDFDSMPAEEVAAIKEFYEYIKPYFIEEGDEVYIKIWW